MITEKNRAPFQNMFCLFYGGKIEIYILRTGKYPKTENDNHFIFGTEVCSYEGVGRFVMGLPDELEILETEDFKNHLKEKLKNSGF